jgi:hypothetical protein
VYLPNRQSLSAMSLRTGVSKLSATSKEFQWQELCQTKLHLKIVLYVITALEFSVKTKNKMTEYKLLILWGSWCVLCWMTDAYSLYIGMVINGSLYYSMTLTSPHSFILSNHTTEWAHAPLLHLFLQCLPFLISLLPCHDSRFWHLFKWSIVWVMGQMQLCSHLPKKMRPLLFYCNEPDRLNRNLVKSQKTSSTTREMTWKKLEW